MPHGAPDWYKYRRDSATHPVDDLAELAVRLGSPVIHDRRGDVIYLDSFEHGLSSWTLKPLGEGASVALTPATALHGGYCVQLITGNIAPGTTQIYRFIPYPQGTRLGYEYAFAYDADVARIWSRLALYDGATRHGATFTYDPQTQKVRIFTNDYTWVDIAGSVNLDTDPTHFHRVKMVFDTSTGKYVRLFLDNLAFDLSAHTYYQWAEETTAKLHFNFYLQTAVDDNRSAYLDAVVITQDEP